MDACKLGRLGKETQPWMLGAYIILRSFILKVIAWHNWFILIEVGIDGISEGVCFRLGRGMKDTSEVLEDSLFLHGSCMAVPICASTTGLPTAFPVSAGMPSFSKFKKKKINNLQKFICYWKNREAGGWVCHFKEWPVTKRLPPPLHGH